MRGRCVDGEAKTFWRRRKESDGIFAVGAVRLAAGRESRAGEIVGGTRGGVGELDDFTMVNAHGGVRPRAPKLYLEARGRWALAIFNTSHSIIPFSTMTHLRALLGIILAALGLFSVAACSKKSDDHAHGHHHHTAPHGGTLVELGEHQFNLEIVRDAAAGTLTVYVLDGHAENFIRTPLPGIALIATVNGLPQPLALTASASQETGEKVGDTSAFAGQAGWLKTTANFDVVIPVLEIRGAKFTDVKFNFPKGSDDHDGH